MAEYQSELTTIKRFYSRALDNFRTLRLYLPPSYWLEPERCFPVLYMHDGQNIFGGEYSYSGAGWEIHQVADELIEQQRIEEIVIVGIDNMESERLSEYAHTDGSFEGSSVPGKGLLYEKFLLEDIKPFIEANYRVLGDPENIALMGSSMGGLITLNIGLRHPDVFKKLGVLSPSFWWDTDHILETVRQLPKDELPARMWIDMGDAERNFKRGFFEVVQMFWYRGVVRHHQMACWVIPGGVHSEVDWMYRAQGPLLYFFGDKNEQNYLEIKAVEITSTMTDLICLGLKSETDA
jgi:predicted alpha/beta superfamily hydrolase